jgi:hypothetical protein
VSRRLKRPVLAAQPDVNPSSPSSIGRVASSGGRAAMACGPVAPVGFPRGGLDGCSIWMGRSEPRDANGLAAASWAVVSRWPRAIDRYRSATEAPEPEPRCPKPGSYFTLKRLGGSRPCG